MGYPGLVLDGTGNQIHGQVFTSSQLRETWTRLDAFEGHDYERVITPATLSDGTQVEVYVYVLRAA